MTRYLIIGDGAAGTTAAQTIRQADPTGVIEIYSDDPNPAYYRAALTNYLIGELREDQIWAVPPTFYGENRLKRVLARVESVDPQRAQLTLRRGGPPVTYDHLLVAAGSRARAPAFHGADLPGIMTMRTLQDVRAVMDQIKLHGLRAAVVVGGGPLALEWAQGLHERGVKATIILRGNRFMGNALDQTGSDLLLARLRHAGVTVLLDDEIVAAAPDKHGSLASVTTKNGKKIACQLAGVAIGVQCNSDFLKDSGIALDKRGAIPVDASLRTNFANIYAAGDIAAVEGSLLQLWEPARLQGRVAGQNMTGGQARYAPGVHYFATRLFNLDFASVGEIEPKDGADELVDLPLGGGEISYRKLLLENGQLKGALLLGERKSGIRRQGRAYQRAMQAGMDLSAVQTQLLLPGFDLGNHLQAGELAQKPKTSAGAARTSAELRKSRVIPRANVPAPAPARAPIKAGARPPASLRSPSLPQPLPVGERLRIGRVEDNECVLDDDHVSGCHAEIRWQGADYYLTDLDSKNGTYLAGTRIQTAVPLPPAARIRIGRTVFEFVQEAQPVAVETPPKPVRESRLLLTIGLGTQQLGLEEPGGAASPLVLSAKGNRWSLTAALTIIGRDVENGITLDDPAVSHVHAQILERNGVHYLQDLGSQNGTWVNDEQIAIPHPLANGDRIRVGKTVLIVQAEPTGQAPFLGAASPVEIPAPPIIETEDLPGPHLVVRSGKSMGLRFELSGKSVVLGRDPACEIWLDETGISWQHAKFSLKGKAWSVTDQDSTNGTWVNEVRLESGRRTALKAQDRLRFGRLEIEFLDGAAAKPCAKCGAALRTATRYCPNCGHPVGEPFQQQNLSVLVVAGSHAGEEVPLTGPIIIGRDPAHCQLILEEASISGRHLEIRPVPGGYEVCDLSSRNGSWLNGERLGTQYAVLSDGDTIKLGRHVVVQVRAE